MTQTPATIQRIVDEQVASIGDAGMREAVRAFLVAPECEERQWDYGQQREGHVCWVVARFRATDTAIAYCENGFGPEYPWGIVTLNDKGMGPDGAWHVSLEHAFRNTQIGRVWNPPGYEVP